MARYLELAARVHQPVDKTRWRVSLSHCGAMRRIESLRTAALLFIAAVVLGIR